MIKKVLFILFLVSGVNYTSAAPTNRTISYNNCYVQIFQDLLFITKKRLAKNPEYNILYDFFRKLDNPKRTTNDVRISPKEAWKKLEESLNLCGNLDNTNTVRISPKEAWKKLEESFNLFSNMDNPEIINNVAKMSPKERKKLIKAWKKVEESIELISFIQKMLKQGPGRQIQEMQRREIQEIRLRLRQKIRRIIREEIQENLNFVHQKTKEIRKVKRMI